MNGRQPRPPKVWAARILDRPPRSADGSPPHPSQYRISGFSTDGRPIYHPTVFQQMIADGVIDRHGYRLGVPVEAKP